MSDDPFAKFAPAASPPQAANDDPFARFAPAPSKPPTAAPAGQAAIAPGGRTTFFPNKLNEPMTGTLLPISRDIAGEYHPALPRIIADVLEGVTTMGARALGVGEEGKDPLRPLAPNEIGAAMVASPASVARGTGRMISGLAAPTTPNAAQQRLLDFEAQGISPNIPAVGQGRASGLTAQASRFLPFSPTGSAIQRNIAETQGALGRGASRLGAPSDEFGAGSVARNALRRFTSDRSTARDEYGEFWGLMQGAREAAIPNTLKVLGDLKRSYPNAPELTGVFTSPPIMRMAEALEPRRVDIPAQASRMLDQFGRPAITRPAQTVERGGRLSIEELRGMRSQIGEKLDQPVIGPDSIPRAQLKQLYGALTNDMYAIAQAHNPEAARALMKANRNYQVRMGIIDRLDRLTNRNAPESVFRDLDRAATVGAGQDTGLLNAVKKVMTPQEWGDVGASIVQRLGNPRPGVAIAPGEPTFSVGSLATNWRKLTPRAKELLFGPDTPGSPRAGLEQLSRVAASIQNVSKLANTSHTYENSAAFALVGELIGSLVSGRLPIPELAAFSGAWGASKLLMSPAFTRWLYRLPNVVSGAPPMMERTLALTALKQALGAESPAPAPASPQATQSAPPQLQAVPVIPQPQRRQPAADADYIETPAARHSVGGP